MSRNPCNNRRSWRLLVGLALLGGAAAAGCGSGPSGAHLPPAPPSQAAPAEATPAVAADQPQLPTDLAARPLRTVRTVIEVDLGDDGTVDWRHVQEYHPASRPLKARRGAGHDHPAPAAQWPTRPAVPGAV